MAGLILDPYDPKYKSNTGVSAVANTPLDPLPINDVFGRAGNNQTAQEAVVTTHRETPVTPVEEELPAAVLGTKR